MTPKLSIPVLALAVLITAAPARLGAQARSAGKAKAPAALDAATVLKAVHFRSIGPTQQSGRFVDFAVPAGKPGTFYAASASGGVWKTENNGQTFEPLFENEKVYSIGDIAVAPSNPEILWLGSGEANNSRSTYWGDGVYKSVDAGKTWVNMGLKESHHIGRIVIHPDEARYRLCRRPRPPLFREPGARALQDDRRRQDLGQGPRRRRRRPGRRRRRRRHGPVRPGDPLCRVLRQVPQALDLGHRRAGLRHPQVDRRRQVLDEADQRPADRHPRPHRPDRLSQEPEDPLCRDRERQQAEYVRRGPLEGDPRRQVELRHDRRRGLPLRRRRGHLDQGQPGEALDRRRPGVLLRPDHRRSERREPRLHPQRRRPGQQGRRQDLDVAVPLRRRQPRPLDRSRPTAGTCSSATTTEWA